MTDRHSPHLCKAPKGSENWPQPQDLRHKGPAGLNGLTAVEAAAKIARGDINSEELVRHCLTRIEARDDDIHAWTFIDPSIAMAQARARDAERPKGPLHGVPVGIKDIMDTVDMPTQYGSPIYRGHRPISDSACVASLRAGGAVILGKTTTTEFASPHPADVRNPHDLTRTPGVSSSGSAAAVADFMVPLALGTQTGGSVIRPASYCGVFGYKATLTGLDRSGLRHLRPTLDTIGLFARSLSDIALARGVMTGNAPASSQVSAGETPRIGICRTPHWSAAKPEMAWAIKTASRKLKNAGVLIRAVELPEPFTTILESFRIIADLEGARALESEIAGHLETLNPWTRNSAISARNWTDEQYKDAIARARECRRLLAGIFEDCDVLLSPGAIGEAHTDLQLAEVDPFNSMWTLMHGPCVTVPAFTGPNGMPLGVQVVGPVNADDRVIALAQWISERLKG